MARCTHRTGRAWATPCVRMRSSASSMSRVLSTRSKAAEKWRSIVGATRGPYLRIQKEREPMKHLLAIAFAAVAFALPQLAQAQDKQRFPELRLDQLTPEQKKWVEAVGAPPRNADFKLPPYRIYMRSPELAARITAMSDYLRWNTEFPARL